MLHPLMVITFGTAFIWSALFVPRNFLMLLLLLFSPFKNIMTVNPAFNLGAAVYLSDIAMLASLLYILNHMIRVGRLPSLPKSVRLTLIVFLLYGVISMIRGVLAYGPPGIGEARKSILFVIFSVYVCMALPSADSVLSFTRTIMKLAYATAVVSLGIILTRFLITGELSRVMPATGGLLIAIGLILAASARIGKLSMSDFTSRMPFPVTIMTVSLLLNAHRSAWAGALVGITIVIMLRYEAFTFRGMVKTTLALVTAGVLLLGSFNLIFNVLYSDELATFRVKWFAFLESGYREDYSANWRILAWLEELDRIRQRPILGSGFGNRLTLYEPHLGWQDLPSHNGHLEILSRQGMVGYLAFWALLIALLRSAIRHSTITQLLSDRQAIQIIIPVLFVTMATGLFYSLEYHFWLILGLLFSLSLRGREPEIVTEGP